MAFSHLWQKTCLCFCTFESYKPVRAYLTGSSSKDQTFQIWIQQQWKFFVCDITNETPMAICAEACEELTSWTGLFLTVPADVGNLFVSDAFDCWATEILKFVCDSKCSQIEIQPAHTLLCTKHPLTGIHCMCWPFETLHLGGEVSEICPCPPENTK